MIQINVCLNIEHRNEYSVWKTKIAEIFFLKKKKKEKHNKFIEKPKQIIYNNFYLGNNVKRK